MYSRIYALYIKPTGTFLVFNICIGLEPLQKLNPKSTYIL